MIYKLFILLIFLCTNSFGNSKPLISIITSVYKGDLFIEAFLKDITKQTIFDKCELIMINANSPGSEELVIKSYLKKYSNIIYVKLDHDPGLYAVWNQAIKLSSSDFIANANLDDRRPKDSLKVLYSSIINFPDVDLVYGPFNSTDKPNQTFAKHKNLYTYNYPEFSRVAMQECLPGPFPLWRKSMHKKYGFFSEKYKSAGDWEMWLRAVSMGAKFKKVNKVVGLYYFNPTGLSTIKSSESQHDREVEELREKYRFLWTDNKKHFDIFLKKIKEDIPEIGYSRYIKMVNYNRKFIY